MKLSMNRTALAALLATASAAAPALPTAFAGTDLSQIVASHYGTAYLSGSTTMLGLNNLGQVLGRTFTRDASFFDTSHTFLIANGVLNEIGAFNASHGTGAGIYGNSLNNQGDVLGYVYARGTDGRLLQAPALYSAGAVGALSLPSTGTSPSLISDTGHIAGARTDTDGRRLKFLWRSDGSYAEFLPGAGVDLSGINSAGTVVGTQHYSPGGPGIYPGGANGNHGFTFDGNKLAYPLMPASNLENTQTVFSGINDAGQIAATLRTFNGQRCDYTPYGDNCYDIHNCEAGVIGASGFQPTPSLNREGNQQFANSRAVDINNRGTLIGYDYMRATAFLSDGTTTVTLNDPRRIGQSNFYGELFDINDADQLLGRGIGSGSPWVLLNPVGANPQAPILPGQQAPAADGGTAFTFTVFAAPATPLFFDPLVAIGYEYEVHSGPSVASILLPSFGDGKYRLELWNGTAWVDAGVELEAGVSFDFLAGVSADGVRKFRIVGIETDVALDPTDPNAFVTGLTFIGSGELKLTQTSLAVDVPAVPEPKTYAMLLLGLGVLLAGTWRRRGSWCMVGPD